jgi:hypothetical protein
LVTNRNTGNAHVHSFSTTSRTSTEICPRPPPRPPGATPPTPVHLFTSSSKVFSSHCRTAAGSWNKRISCNPSVEGLIPPQGHRHVPHVERRTWKRNLEEEPHSLCCTHGGQKPTSTSSPAKNYTVCYPVDLCRCHWTTVPPHFRSNPPT